MNREWLEQASCAGVGSDDWYPEGGRVVEHQARVSARKVCALCPVARECLDYAMTRELGVSVMHRHGIWAGMSPRERSKYEPQWLAEHEIERHAA